MSEAQAGPGAMRAITVSRQYGSGGGEVATRLARRLGWQLIDHEIVARVAHELGITEEEAAVRDEHVESFIARVLSTMQLGTPEVPMPLDEPPTPAVEARTYHEALCRVVLAAVDEGCTVIVGRGGQVVLKDRRDVLHVRVVAPLDMRVAYVARREGLDEARARARIQLKDRDRTRYLQVQHRSDPDEPLCYDLVVNTAVLDLDTVVDMICLALERKARRLVLPDAELGPGAGLQPYAGRPADLRPPSGMVAGERDASS